MIRKQLYIDEDLERGLKRLSRRTGRPEADHVREALRTYLASERAEDTQETRDPLLDLVGMVKEQQGPTDVAEEHDHYLYGAPRRRPKRRRE